MSVKTKELPVEDWTWLKLFMKPKSDEQSELAQATGSAKDPHFDKTFCMECGKLAEECKGHPEATCDDCAGRNVVWHAPNEIWNKVCRPNGEICADPMLCPRCFILRAIKAGIDVVWCVSPDSQNNQ